MTKFMTNNKTDAWKTDVNLLIRPHEKEKPAFLNSSGLKSVFEKLILRDRLVWTVGLTVEIKLRLQIPLAQCGRRLS